MKKLEELGISPAPWQVVDEDVVFDAEGVDVNIAFEENDARFVAASPKLYKALYELVEAYEACNAHDGTCGNCERRKMCQQDEERIIANAKSALAEAAGEGGADK